jgi:hypothetical protein
MRTLVPRWPLFLLLFAATNAWALDAKQIFELVSPATVLIEDIDSQGSGVFLSEKGLILTNYHVVAANIDLKVKAKVRFGNRVVLTEIDNVKVTKIHPEYDIALLEATPPPNGAFIPARLITKDVAVATGSKCYAIGNPGGPGGNTLELTITEGIVSAASRKVEGLDYVQFSAAINPGNSGGPVCDEQGRVFAIATWKMTQTEGIGFGIPTQKLWTPDFIEPKARKRDPDLANRAQEEAGRYFNLAMRATGRERTILLMACADCYRICMLAVPDEATPYSNLAVVYQRLEQIEIAKKYCEAALRIDPSAAMAAHMLGAMSIPGQSNNPVVAKKCMDMWFAALLGKDDSVEGKYRCAEDLAVLMVNQKKFVASAYALQWGRSILPAGSPVRRTDIWQDLERLIPAETIQAIRAKAGGFTREEFDALGAGKPFQGAAATAALKSPTTPPGAGAPLTPPTVPPKAPGTPSAQPPAVATPGFVTPVFTPAQLEQVQKAAAAVHAAKQISVPATGTEFPLPEHPDRAVFGNSGWQIVFSFPALTKIGVFNIATAKFDGFIDCSDNSALFSAGGRVLSVYLPSTQTMELYDLDTLKQLASKKLTLPGPPILVSMGLLNPSRVTVLCNVGEPNTLAVMGLTVPDLKLAEFVLEKDANGQNPFAASLPSAAIRGDGGKFAGAMDDSGQQLVFTRTGPGPGGLGYLRDLGNGRVTGNYGRLRTGAPAFAHGGSLVVTEQGVYIPNTAENLKRESGAGSILLAPIAGYAGYLEQTSSGPFTGFRVRSLPSMNVLVEIPVTLPAAAAYRGSHALHANVPRLFASTATDRIALVQPEEKKINLYRLGLKSGVADARFAQPGKLFVRKLKVPAGGTPALQSGPNGMKIDEKDQMLQWHVPADFKPGQTVQAIILVTLPGGGQEYLIEKIAIP